MASISDFQNIILPTTGEHLNEESFVHFMESLKLIKIAEFNPPSWLNHLESPLKWIQVLTPATMYKYDVDKKLQDYPEDDQYGIYTFEKFCLHLIKVVQNVLMKNQEYTEQSLQQLKCVMDNISKNKSDDMYSRIGSAFEHVLSAVTTHISFLHDDLSEEHFNKSKVDSHLMSYSEMERTLLAGIEAIKGRFYLSATTDINFAKTCLKKANELDPEFGAWLYWTGKILRKECRHNKNRDIEEELYYFESAVKIKRDPKYLLYLAQCYHEKAKFIYSKMRSNSREQEILYKKSMELYRECWGLKRDSAAINRRLGNGVMTLFRPYADYELAEEALLLAEQICKQPITYHILGTFYSKHKQDYLTAIKFFTKGAENGSLYCFNELIRLKYIMCYPNYDPYEDLKIQETSMKYSLGIHTVYCDLLWYFLSLKPDLHQAMTYFWKIVAEDDYSLLTRFRCYTFLLNGHVNICAIFMKHVKRFQEENKEEGNDEAFGRLFNFFSENPNLLLENEKSLTTINNNISRNLQKEKNFIERSFKKNHHMQDYRKKLVGPEKEVCRNESNLKYEPREATMSVDQKRQPVYSQNYSQNRRTYPEKYKVENWRAECKVNDLPAKVPDIKK